MSKPDIISWVAAPTTSGPRSAASDGARTKATSRERWDAWMAAHPDVVPAVLARARSIVVCRAGDARGNPRVSAKEITEWIRATYRVSINNSATAGLGEWLSEHEDLRPYVERRGKAAP